jgi:hypothetical protein
MECRIRVQGRPVTTADFKFTAGTRTAGGLRNLTLEPNSAIEVRTS